jgi:hypothetical protein
MVKLISKFSTYIQTHDSRIINEQDFGIAALDDENIAKNTEIDS